MKRQESWTFELSAARPGAHGAYQTVARDGAVGKDGPGLAYLVEAHELAALALAQGQLERVCGG